MNPLSIIVAVDKNFGMGFQGDLPWKISGDMKHFKKITTDTDSSEKKNVVIMGRKTWESLPQKFRPLPGRVNGVLTRQLDYDLPAEVLTASSLEEILENIKSQSLPIERVFVIGGAQVFKEALEHPQCQNIYITYILKEFVCDVFFPQNLSAFEKVEESSLLQENGISFFFVKYVRK